MSLQEHGIHLRSHTMGNHKTVCPQCSNQRKNKKDPCLSVTVKPDGAVWNCHHCGWSGGYDDRFNADEWKPRKREYKKPSYKPQPVTDPLIEFFSKRGIDAETVASFNISVQEVWMPGDEGGKKSRAICFPYYRGEEVVNVKYRTHDKRFRQEKDAEKIFFGLDKIAEAETVVITEGEFDAMVANQCGFPAISVPDGAPKQAVGEGSTKFQYLDNCIDDLAGKAIIIAVDADEPGQVLEAELSRRLGRENCRRAKYPDGCKDLNEVLLQAGAEAVEACLNNADFFPMDGIFSIGDYREDVIALYRNGRARGLSTGWLPLDEILTVRAGDLWVVTGVANNGKSEWLDALSVNMAENHGWKYGICSPENEPDEHIAKIAEKHERKPFWDGPSMRMTQEELERSMDWAHTHFALIRSEGDTPPTVDWIIDRAKALVRRMGINGLVIDPYNEIQKEIASQSETEFVSGLLSKLKRFAQKYEVAVFLVAHPKQMSRDKDGVYPVPSLYDISGSANWANKADVGVVVHRGEATVAVHVKKCRRKEIGTQGVQEFVYNKIIGRYDAIDANTNY